MTALSVFSLLAMAAAPLGAPSDVSPGNPLDYQVAMDKCIEEIAGDSDIKQCYGTAIKAAEVRLAKAQNDLLTAFAENPKAIANLVDEQKAWEDYRKQACAIYWSASEFGSINSNINAPDCLLSVVETRATHLEGIFLNLVEG